MWTFARGGHSLVEQWALARSLLLRMLRAARLTRPRPRPSTIFRRDGWFEPGFGSKGGRGLQPPDPRWTATHKIPMRHCDWLVTAIPRVRAARSVDTLLIWRARRHPPGPPRSAPAACTSTDLTPGGPAPRACRHPARPTEPWRNALRRCCVRKRSMSRRPPRWEARPARLPGLNGGS